MKDQHKTKEELIKELKKLRQRVSKFEAAEIERRDTEQALRESEARNRAILRAIPDLMFRCDRDGRFWDYYAARRDQLFVSPEEFLGKRILDVLPKDAAQRCMECIEQAFCTGDVQAVEYKLPMGDNIFDFEARIVTIDENILVIIRNISDRKQAVERLKSALHEKEILLKEIYHRVKNNLQMVSTLLYLQSEAISDENVCQILKESQNRINSMMMIHEQMYRSKDLARIDIHQYIHDLVVELFRSHDLDPSIIELIVDVNNILIGIDTAIPCGLIINELISNSFKHAFPDDREGKIKIDFFETETHYHLIVSDNGIGFPEAVDFRGAESMGLELINDLTVHQLDGTVELERAGGTTFKIIFPKPEYREV